MSNEESLDDIFGELKGKQKIVQKETGNSKGKRDTRGDDLGFTQKGYAEKIKYTTEGYPIYTPEELKLGQGGGTEQCPFDCDCCY